MLYPVLEEKASYTFADYFNMGLHVEDVLKHFGYSYEAQYGSQMPRAAIRAEQVAALKAHLLKNLPFLDLTSEIARREFLIAPVILELNNYTQVKIRPEYPLRYTEQLKGTLDYLLRAEQNLLVIEAKREDLVRGFTQLAVELVALDGWLDSPEPLLYGAVSTGSVWQFGVLHRQQKKVIQCLDLYRVPADLHELMGILVGILSGAEPRE